MSESYRVRDERNLYVYEYIKDRFLECNFGSQYETEENIRSAVLIANLFASYFGRGKVLLFGNEENKNIFKILCEHLIIKSQKHIVEPFKSKIDMCNYIRNIFEETNEHIKNYMTMRKKFLEKHRIYVKSNFSKEGDKTKLRALNMVDSSICYTRYFTTDSYYKGGIYHIINNFIGIKQDLAHIEEQAKNIYIEEGQNKENLFVAARKELEYHCPIQNNVQTTK